MKKNIMKTSIYTFIVTMAILLVFIPRTKMTTDLHGIGSAFEYTYPEYFLMLLKYSIIFSCIVTIIFYIFISYRSYKR